MEDFGSVCPFVQIFDAPMPQTVDQFAELLNLEEDVLDAGRLVDRYFQVPEAGYRSAMFIIEDVRMRTSVPEPQLAEQLVEVPTFFSCSSLQRTAEHYVDIPVPGGGGPSSGLQGFSSGQSSTASPSSKKRISDWRIVEQIVDPVSSGRLPGSSSSHSPAGVEERADEPVEGVFRTFPKNKKSAKLGSHSGSELLPESSPSTPAAQLKEEMEVLFAVPLQLRTPAQRARLRELISASSQAREEEEEEEEEEADASCLLSSWPRSSSTTTVVCLQCWFYWL